MTAASNAGPVLRRSYLVWGVAVAAYVVAVAHRSSFGVAGIEATDRFGVAATVLSLFTVIQLAVYAGAQVPAGLLLDRFGSRTMIATGALIMTVGQIGMMLSESVGLALAARVLIGAGDSLTFVSVIRLVPSWFPPRRVPLITQLTGLLGQLGQVVSAVPFVLILDKFGWPQAFVGLVALGLVATTGARLFIRDRPTPREAKAAHVSVPRPQAATGRPGTQPEIAPTGLGAVVRAPGNWLGFWTHMVTSFSLNVFTLLWGYPFLVLGQGRTPAEASGLLTLSVGVAIIAGPLIGEFTARHPLRRSWAVIGIGSGVGLAWALVLIPSTPRPMWILMVFVTLLAVGGPGSVIGFDYARTFNPPKRMGAATGLVNMGGFSAAVVAVFGIGVVLDEVQPDGNYTLGDFRIALAVIAVPWVLAMIGVIVSRARTRLRMADEGVIVPPVSEAWARWRARD